MLNELAAIKDQRYRLRLDPKLNPSILMYTFHNTHSTCVIFIKLSCFRCTSIDISDDVSMLACGSYESFIKIWDLTGSGLRSLKSSTEILPADFENLDDVTRGLDNTPDPHKKLVGHSGPVYGVSFSFDNRYLVSASEDGTGFS